MNKKLYRSRENRVLSGVCGGIGEYFNIDPVIVRIILVALALLGWGTGILVYIIAIFIIPEKPYINGKEPKEKDIVEAKAEVMDDTPDKTE